MKRLNKILAITILVLFVLNNLMPIFTFATDNTSEGNTTEANELTSNSQEIVQEEDLENDNLEDEQSENIENEETDSEDVLNDNSENEDDEEEIENLESDEYFIEDDTKIISKVLPKTEVASFKENFSILEDKIKIYEDETCQKEVTQGYIGTGMCLKYNNDEKLYKISVIGDINKDGQITIVELNKFINYILNGVNELDETQKKSLDVICDNELDVADVTAIIRYLVYGELDVSKTTYTIEYYKEKIDTDEYELVQTKTKIDSIGERVYAEDLKYEGFILTQTNDSKQNDILDKAGNLKLKMFYKRNRNSLKINKNIGNIIYNQNELEDNVMENAKFEKKINLNFEVDQGYNFNGWKILNDKGQEVNVNLDSTQLKQYNIEFSMPNENIIVEPSIEIDTYKINYYLNGGVLQENNPTTYNKLQDDIILKAPTRNGYMFKGWTGSNGEEAQKEVKIEKGTSGNLYFVANWVMQVNAPTIVSENEQYTNNNIKITMTYPDVTGTTKQYRKYGENWITVEENPEEIECEQNTVIYARILNNQGEVTDIAEKQISNIDKTSPKINNISISNTELTDQNIKIFINAQDQQSGLISYRFGKEENIDADSEGWEEIENTKEQITKQYTIKENGTYYFFVKDLAGNISNAEDGKIEINNIERSIPVIKATRDNADISKKTKIKIDIEYTGKSKLSEANSYQYYISKSNQDLVGGMWKDYTIGEEFEEGENLTGEYYLYIKEVKDELGNTSEQNGTKIGNYHLFSSLKFDNTAPIVKFEKNGNKVYLKEQKTKVTIDDVGEAGVKSDSLKYLWSQNSQQPNADDFTNQFANGDEIKIENENGIYYLWIMAEDNLGNAVIQRSKGFYLDNQMPTIEKPATVNIMKTNISVELKQDDEKSKIDTNNIYFGIKESTQDDFVWTKSNSRVFLFKNLEFGKTYDIKTKVIDKAGNGYIESEELSNIQTTSANDIYIMHNPTTWTNGDVTIDIIYPNLDGNIKKQYSFNNQEWQETEDNSIELKIDENRTIFTRVLDENQEIVLNKQYTISNIDKQKPNIQMNDNTYTYETKDNALINVNLLIQDNESGINQKEYAWSNSNETIPSSWNLLNDTNTISENKPIGEYYLWIKARDNAENETIITSSKFIVREAKSFTIQYNAVDGNGAPSNQKKYINETIKLSTKIPNKEGYIFLGWTTKQNGTEVEYKPGAEFNLNENTTLYALWSKAIYKRGNIYYLDLSTAVKNAKSNDVITLLENATDKTEVVINKKINFDLNGKNLTILKTIKVNEKCTLNITGSGNLTTSEGINLIQNNGTLNIVGSVNLSSTNTESQYVIENIGTLNQASIGKISGINKTIGNAGTLVIKSGTIESKNEIAILNIGTLNINGGKVLSTNNIAIQNEINAKIEMQDGIVTGGKTGIQHDSKTDLIILGGTISGKKQGINTITILKSGNIILGKESEQLIGRNPIITGDEYGIQCLNSEDEIILYNGVIRGKIDNGYVGNIKCREDCIISTTKSGDYTETSQNRKQESFYSVGNKKYATLKDAVVAAKSGDVITVIKNATDQNNVTIDKDVTIDTNGYTLTRTTPINVNEKVTVTIAGKGELIMNGPNHLIVNRGTLKVEHQGTIKNVNTGAYAVIYNLGNLTKTGTGTIESLGTTGVIINQKSVTISEGFLTAGNGHTISNSKDTAKTTIKGGTIENTGKFYAINNLTYAGEIEITGGNVKTNYRTIYNEKGTINIKGGTISASGYGIRQKGIGKINISGGTIQGTESSKSYGIVIENSKSVTKITGGTIKGNEYAIYDTASSSITIGTNSGNINNTTPSIIGEKYSIHMPSATTKFYFYSGVLKGKTTPGYYGTPTIRSGYSAVTTYSGGYYNTTQGTAVYSINTTPVSYATTLASAVTNANSGSTITLLKNNKLDNALTINKNITLNTNGKTLTSTQTITIAKGKTTTIKGSGIITSATQKKNLISNQGTLKLAHTGTIRRTNDNNDSNYVISNSGTLNKTGSGKITSDNRAIYNTGTFTMSAGTISVEGFVAINNTSNGTANLNGGTIESKENIAIYNNSAKTLLVNGATIKANGGGYSVEAKDYNAAIRNMSTGSVKVKKGNIQGYFYAIKNNSTGKVYVEGGTLSNGSGVTNYEHDSKDYISSTIINNSTGEINISGGTLKAHNYKVANMQKGIVNINGGIIQGKANVLTVEIMNKGQGTINFKKGTIKTNGTGIENESNGTIKMTGGTISTFEGGYIEGINNGSKGNFVMTGGTMNIGGYGCAIRSYGTGTINISGGTITANERGIECINENITISGGSISSKYESIINGRYSGYTYGSGNLTISGGKIICTGDDQGNGREAICFIGKNIKVTGGTIRGYKGKNSGTYSGRTDMVIYGNYSISNLKYTKTPNVLVYGTNGKKWTPITFK